MKRSWFSIGTYGAKFPANTGTLWRTAESFGANYIFTIGERYKHQRADTRKAWREIPMFQYDEFDSFYSSLPKGCKLIGAEISKRSVGLTDFRHPLRAVYLLGAEDIGLPNWIQEKCDSIIQIPNASYCLNVALTGGIIMYDRHDKLSKGMFDDHRKGGRVRL